MESKAQVCGGAGYWSHARTLREPLELALAGAITVERLSPSDTRHLRRLARGGEQAKEQSKLLESKSGWGCLVAGHREFSNREALRLWLRMGLVGEGFSLLDWREKDSPWKETERLPVVAGSDLGELRGLEREWWRTELGEGMGEEEEEEEGEGMVESLEVFEDAKIRNLQVMESSGGNSDPYRNPAPSSGGSRRYDVQFSASNFIQAPLSALLEYSGILRPRSNHSETESLVGGGVAGPGRLDDSGAPNSVGGEVSIRIIGAGDHENTRVGLGIGSGSLQTMGAGETREGVAGDGGVAAEQVRMASERQVGDGGSQAGVGEATNSSNPVPVPPSSSGNGNGMSAEGEAAAAGGNGRESSYQRYDIQQVARWIEQILPFSLLLLVVFIRQHLQGLAGFIGTIWIAAVMFKSNEILRKQTALKGERKISVLVGITLLFMIHVFGVYWWYKNDDLLYPLVLLPPKEIPQFWHAIFIIMVNDTMVRQAAMVVKCMLLMYYKNSRGRNYRKQGQMLTLVEYLLLLYRALLPTPVWYRFFLNKEYGSLFSSLTTGLYLTFKLTSVVEKVQSFVTALKALSRKDVHYGSHATTEQVIAAGDLCAICQEKMHAPILLRCKHIFCEDCVSEWFERERTCPLCRALVKPADLRSFGDGSTSLFFQLF
ncbi:hypothetical protein J5N97_013649 [Dioscorea zingiberensis]|uniref:RING-type domain-containing protein n=1 Tax=Dioscorea zingiberensis TaxID=325984 RepID=A0A9D5CTQ0_9LILI|nr:hypothetical protein J5N97_013649 [Dioscorea zingiberensis]